MKILPPDYTETRDKRTLLVWADLPYWTVVDNQAARFIENLSSGLSVGEALGSVCEGEPSANEVAASRSIVDSLKKAGVIGSKRLPDQKERIESITVNVTNRCNLSCPFCYNQYRELPADELSADEFIEALSSLGRGLHKGAAIAILGGEPLLEPCKTLAVAEWAQTRGLTTVVSTNGTLVTSDIARRAAEVGLRVQISIDDPRAGAHDRARGKGVYAKAVDAVELLVATGVHTTISMVCHADNWQKIPQYLRFARKLGANGARFIPLKRFGPGGPDRADPVEVIRLVTRTIRKEPGLAELLGQDMVSILATACRQCGKRRSCGAGGQTILLDADGAVYPCINLAGPELYAGNVREESLRSILTDAEVLQDVKRQIGTEGRGEPCSSCTFRYWCMGVCRGETYHGTSELTGPSVTCELNRASIIESFWALTECPELGDGDTRHMG